jgi:hypothetical protein
MIPFAYSSSAGLSKYQISRRRSGSGESDSRRMISSGGAQRLIWTSATGGSCDGGVGVRLVSSKQ